MNNSKYSFWLKFGDRFLDNIDITTDILKAYDIARELSIRLKQPIIIKENRTNSNTMFEYEIDLS